MCLMSLTQASNRGILSAAPCTKNLYKLFYLAVVRWFVNRRHVDGVTIDTQRLP